MNELMKAKELIENSTNLGLATHNKNNGNEGWASFHRSDENIIFVFEGNPDGSDDKSMTLDEFIANYDYEVKED